ncbi:RAVE subunit 2/Rogdi [Fusarium sp. MPI-SDFR-AT-0072]|nr:RAVE subunit 2/Rogdi [Fusarium sp. MPI-SDFR-AT-0072]
MSIAIWPPVSPAELRLKASETQARELDWIVDETLEVCRDLKHGLEDCYALLAPIDPGSTLVMSTPRNEKVKGTLTRVGTRIVKGTIHLQLRTIPPQTLSLSQSKAIHVQGLDALHGYLNQSIDLLAITLSKPQDASSLASTLSILADSLSDSSAILKGPPLTDSDPAWQMCSCSPDQFVPSIGPNLSFYLGLQESCIILWLRALEPVHAHVHFGTKLGLAFGTVRRLEHDEMDTVFRYNTQGSNIGGSKRGSARHTPEPGSSAAEVDSNGIQEVYVREKVRVESADPSLISIQSKLSYLSHMLGQARRNIAEVLSVDS